ncbi:hypothetical protein B739_1423 [Riemerella anatipestifer RA-CH-1]|uniref:Uncharacterized protein n=1 Tax=Riemerella anatipestifer RA-CH-1 TaxID=1228997 RepID=J9QTJ3_RIEAN|nr:hypothetical protein B739_1423 [Riemerella anatipestifer RA-CH-1]
MELLFWARGEGFGKKERLPEDRPISLGNSNGLGHALMNH